MKKILSILLVLTFMYTCLPAMAHRNVSLSGLPDILEVKYEDSFNGIQNQRIVLGNSALYDAENGNISLTNNTDTAYIYFNRNKSDVAGCYAVDLSLSRDITNNGEAWIYLGRNGSGEGRQMDIRWRSEASGNNNHVTIYNRATDAPGEILADSSVYGTADTLKLTVKFDTVSGKVSIWVNGKPAAKDNTTYFLASSLQFIRVTNQSYAENATTDSDGEHIRIEDVKFYSVPVESMPVPDEIYSHYTFDEDSTAVTTDYPVAAAGSPTFEVKDGALYVTNPLSTGANAARIMLSPDKKGIADEKLMVEYTLSSSVAPSNRAITFCIAQTHSASLVNTWNNGKIKVNGTEYADSVYGTVYTAKLTYLFDTLAKTYSLWINDVCVLTDVAYASGTTDGTVLRSDFIPYSAGGAVEEVKVGLVKNFVPGKYNVLFKEEFNSAEELASNTKLTMTEMKSNYTWGGGAVMAKASDTTQPYTRAAVTLDKSDIKGNIYINFKLGRNLVTTANEYSRIYFALAKDETASAWANYAALQWNDSSLISASPSPVTSSSADSWMSLYSASSSLDFTFEFDVTNGTQSLWLNGKAAYVDQALSDEQKGYLANGIFRFSVSNQAADKPVYIRHLEIWQDNGKPAMRLTSDNKLEFIADKAYDGALFYGAGYNDDTLNKLDTAEFKLEAGKVYFADVTEFSGFEKFKAFWWTDSASMKPVTINVEK